MIELVSRPHATRFVAWAKDKPEVLVLSADLTNSCEVGDFKTAYPERFFSMGMAEQNMMGFAAGLAREGFEPWIHTFAVFICRRAFDQVAMSIAYPNLPVRLLGFLPGLTTPGGVTHQAIDDLALMRAIPNMTVLECGDASEVEQVLDEAHALPGPVYVRMLRGLVPRLFSPSNPMKVGQARVLSRGADLTIVSSGICTEEALRAIQALQNHGLQVYHLHVNSLHPFDEQALLSAANSTRHGVITIENHSIIGGLGSATAEVLAEHAVGKPLRRLGLKRTYAHGASRAYLLREYGLDAAALVKASEELTGMSFAIDAKMLDSMPIEKLDQPEAL